MSEEGRKMELRDNEGEERNGYERKGRRVVSWWKEKEKDDG